VETHCRSAGHRECEATLGAIKEYVAGTTMAKDVKVFVQNCLHCVATIPGDKVPRPLGTQIHATKPNGILHFDFLYIGLSKDGKYQYVLLLKDDLVGIRCVPDDCCWRWQQKTDIILVILTTREISPLELLRERSLSELLRER
jgi:Integrase zinc binding domain